MKKGKDLLKELKEKTPEHLVSVLQDQYGIDNANRQDCINLVEYKLHILYKKGYSVDQYIDYLSVLLGTKDLLKKEYLNYIKNKEV